MSIRSYMSCAVAATLCVATSFAPAAVVTQVGSNAMGEHWETNVDWDWASAGVSSGAYGGHDFVNPAGLTIRTPEAGGDTFNGKSLTVSGVLALKKGSGASTHTVTDLRLAGGSIENFTGGTNTQTLAGGLTVVSDSAINISSATDIRHITISAAVSGSAQMDHRATKSGDFMAYTNAANTFDGTWKVSSGVLKFSNAGAVGDGDILVAGGKLQILGDWLNEDASLTVSGGAVDLGGYAWTVESLWLGVNQLAAGTYSVTSLNSYGVGSFTGTVGTITVVPEPVSLSLLALGGLAILRRRR